MKTLGTKLFYALMCASLFLSLIGVRTVHAAAFVVTNDSDSGGGSLREAMTNANASAGPHQITFAGDYTITLASQLPAVTTQISITGNGAEHTIIQAAEAADIATYRVLEVGVDGDLTLDGLTVRNGRCNGACSSNATAGGGIYNEGTLMVTNSTLSGNSENGIGNVGTLTVTNSTLSGNSAYAGGGIWNNGGTLTVTNTTFSGNSATALGGGIYSYNGALTLTDSTLSGNSTSGSGGSGGGIANEGSTLIVANSGLSGNSVGGNGGGIWNHDGTLTVMNTTLSGNNASGHGGGVFNDATLTVTNSTFSGNSTNGGGGIGNWGALTVTNSTFSGNSSYAYGGGGILNSGGGTLNLLNTIIANSSAGGDCTGSVDTHSHNLIEDAANACGLINGTSGNIVGADAKLGLVADNGGPTPTMALLSGSPAIDKGNDAICAAAPVSNKDQRGATRPRGPRCDIGAYESEGAGPLCLVDIDAATGYNNGMSWANAYTDLQSALENLDCHEIWVAEGVYKAGVDRSDAFSVSSGMALYGGFVGSEGSPSERVPGLHVTILSGDIDGDDDGSNADGNFIGEAYADILGNNSYHVLKMDGTSTAVTGTTVLDRFTITAGDADGSEPPDNRGGGLQCDGSNAGTCSPTLTNLAFVGNYASGAGGAIFSNGHGGTSSPSLTSVTFSGNGSAYGGAIYNYSWNSGLSSPTFTNVTFANNHADFFGGALCNDGANGTSSPTFTNVTFHGNSATTGGAMFNGAPESGSTSAPVLTNVILWGDIASASMDEIFNYSPNNNSATPSIDHSVMQGGCPSRATCTNLVTADPMLSTLGNNGGFSETMALLAGSSAIDTGDDTACAAAPVNGVDQRGISRPRGPQCDIGAFERLPDPAAFSDGYESDVVLYRGGAWQFYDFTTGLYLPGSSQWTGNPGGCVPAPMDYDGDGTKDFTQLCGTVWHFYDDTGDYVKGIATTGGFPVPADYDGDGTDEVVVFNAGAWHKYNFATGAYDAGVWTGNPGGIEVPTPMDYNGDGLANRTILSSGAWHLYNADGSYNKGIWVGNVAGQLPVPGDYNGDGTDDVWVYRTGAWLPYNFSTGAYLAANSVWTGNPPPPAGGGATKPAPLDYDGDGKLDFTVFAGGPWHFYNDNGSYLKGIWVGKNTADLPISRRLLP